MNRLFLFAACALGACTFNKDVPDAALPEVFVGFHDAASTADEKSKNFPISVELSAATTVDVVVEYQIEPGPGVEAGDFKLLTDKVTIPAGETTAPLLIDIETDTLEEGDEHLDITLVEPTNAQIALAASKHDLTIRAKALPRVSFEAATSSAQEPVDATFNAKLDETSDFDITATYVVTSAGAVANTDFILADGTVTFPAGMTSVPLVIDVLDDSLDEDTETVTVTLMTATNAVVEATAAAHAHAILDDMVDPQPTVQFAAGASVHGEADGMATIGVTLSAPSGRTIMVPYSVAAASTATGNADYTITAGPLVIPAGMTTGTIAVTIVNDTADEPSENLLVDMGGATNATNAGTQQHRFQIDDDDQICYGAAPFSVCLDAAPTNAVTLPASINTTNAGICAAVQPANWVGAPQNQPPACFVIGNTITGASTVVQGNRPLVLLAHTSIAISGTLDASSSQVGGSTGPASPSGDCSGTAMQQPGSSATGGGGGAGGSFMSKGGDGGSGDAGDTAAGTAAAASGVPTKLRAGCDGQKGGNASAGVGGRGGGAIYLVSGNTLKLEAAAVINASGGGANGGGTFSGGSGAGSGGMIRLHAGTLVAAAGSKILANGGGGSSGGDNNDGGGAGGDPDPGTPASPAAGGSSNGGATGGDGFAGATAAEQGDNANANEGGGGGGGGGGLIQSNQALTNVTASAGLIQQ